LGGVMLKIILNFKCPRDQCTCDFCTMETIEAFYSSTDANHVGWLWEHIHEYSALKGAPFLFKLIMKKYWPPPNEHIKKLADDLVDVWVVK
jgi:hypothetical protein